MDEMARHERHDHQCGNDEQGVEKALQREQLPQLSAPGSSLCSGVVPGREDSFGNTAKCTRELARNDPDLVGISLCDLREHLEILVCEQLRVGIALVDRLEDR